MNYTVTVTYELTVAAPNRMAALVGARDLVNASLDAIENRAVAADVEIGEPHLTAYRSDTIAAVADGSAGQ